MNEILTSNGGGVMHKTTVKADDTGWGWWASCNGCGFRAWSGNSRAQAVESAREHRASVKAREEEARHADA